MANYLTIDTTMLTSDDVETLVAIHARAEGRAQARGDTVRAGKTRVLKDELRQRAQRKKKIEMQDITLPHDC